MHYNFLNFQDIAFAVRGNYLRLDHYYSSLFKALLQGNNPETQYLP